MKFEIMQCPDCGEPAMGTCDLTPGCALFSEPDENGHVEYEGETEMYWDGQISEEETRDGATYTKLQCHEGHEWFTKEVTE